MTDRFDDLLAANERFTQSYHVAVTKGVARAGVAVVTCMDSRIDPLAMVGLRVGDAKVLRNAGGRVTDSALTALVLAVNLLGVDRILVVPHTRCAVASSSQAELRQRVGSAVGTDASWVSFGVIEDQHAALADDVRRIRTHPLIPDSVSVGGFIFDVDNGRLHQVL